MSVFIFAIKSGPFGQDKMAERVGFEPTDRVTTVTD